MLRRSIWIGFLLARQHQRRASWRTTVSPQVCSRIAHRSREWLPNRRPLMRSRHQSRLALLGCQQPSQLGAIDGLQCGFSTTFCAGFFRNVLTAEFTTVKAGEGFTCGLRPDGQIWCWGLNNLGQLGRGTTTPNPTAEQLRMNSTPTPINSALRFGSIAVGSSHACGVTRETRSVWCWGDNTYGQLGNRSRTNSPIPVEALRRG